MLFQVAEIRLKRKTARSGRLFTHSLECVENACLFDYSTRKGAKMSYQKMEDLIKKELNDLNVHITILSCNIESAENRICADRKRLRELKDRRLSFLLHSGDILSTAKEIIKAKIDNLVE